MLDLADAATETPAVHATAPAAPVARHVMSTAVIYLHDWLSDSFDALKDFDYLDFVIAASVWNANTRFLADDLKLLHRFCFEHSFVPLEMRVPTSRGAVARFLNIPQETVRRRVESLVQSGILGDRGGGLIAKEFPRMLKDLGATVERTGAERLIRLERALVAGGFDLPPRLWGGDGVDIPAGWLRAVTRFSIDFVLLMISEFAAVLDISVLELFLVLAIVRSDLESRTALDPNDNATEVLPDRLRKPVMASAARRLSKQPHATARRRLKSLEVRGVIERAGRGYVVPAAMIQAKIVDSGLASRTATYLRRMFDRLNALAEFERAAS